MKKILPLALGLLSTSGAFAQSIELDTLTEDDFQHIGNEFAVSYSHTTVSAPETRGVWGVELGLVGGKTQTPKLADSIDGSGEDGSDWKSIYHAGLMARAHGPFELFAELSWLPERDINEVTIANKTMAVGWNFGSFFELPVDVAVGMNFSNTALEFDQVVNNASTSFTDRAATVSFDASTRVLWVGASKQFAWVTPYVKMGSARSEADIKTEARGGPGSVLASGKNDDTTSSSGWFMALGANAEFSFFRFGLEGSQTIDAKRLSGKISVAF
jgi:hypothetical protein